ncbi:MAG TPA: AAA family ATPase, partial [Roseiflexaceae bacterium]|nr:AAA family ATPase [Roseiflexaceae bacterium]
DLLRNVEGIVVAEQRGAWGVVAALDTPEPPAPLAPPAPLPSHIAAQLIHVVHPMLAQRLEAGEDAFVNEHRNVTVLWVGFNDLDYDGDMAAGAALQEYVCAALEIIHRYGGYLNRVDMGDKGSKLLALFGAPVMHEDDAVRAVRCALELRALHQQLGASGGQPRMGISSGFLFCGHVGAPDRQEYTVMGDAIILAVRLLQAAAPGQLLISDATHDALDEPFDLQPFAPIQVKGRSEPVDLWHVNGEATQALTRTTERTTPLIGREQELATARHALDHAEQKHGQILFITAEAGIGKSRLGAEIARHAAERGFRTLSGACQSYGTRANYLLWHDVWRGFFGLDPRQPIQHQQRQIEEQLAALAPEAAAHAPLLGPVLNMPLPDNDVTRSLDGQMRQNALHALLLQCLRARFGQRDEETRRGGDKDTREQPSIVHRPSSIVVLEDCHWIDPLSLELLEFLGRNVANLPIVLVVIHRPIEDEQHTFVSMARMPHATTIDLPALTSAEAEQIVGAKLKQLFGIEPAAQAAHARFGMEPDPLHELVERIVARAEGNPFYIEELVNFIHDQGIDPHDRRAFQALTLPDSLHSLVLSRIDRLSDGEQRTLKVASVVGRTFAPRWLWSSYPALGTPETVVQHLDMLSRLDLTPLDKPAPEPEYMFKHAITQEAAYESLSFAMRARLHERVGQFIEQSYADDLPSFVNVLAHHYERTRNRAKQRIYFRRAADAAKAVYANQTAIYYYDQLLPLLPDNEKSDALLDMGEVLQLIGKWPEAEAAYRQALALAEQTGDMLAVARSEDALGYLLSYTESYDEGLRWLTAARATFEEHGDQRGLGKTLEHLSFLHSQRSEYAEALRCAEQQRQIAAALNDHVGLSNAEANMGLAYQWLGDYGPSLEHFQRSIDI